MSCISKIIDKPSSTKSGRIIVAINNDAILVQTILVAILLPVILAPIISVKIMVITAHKH